MKLVIQIPAWNEALYIAQTIAELPKHISGFDEIEVLVIDDGSTDETALQAANASATLIRQPLHRGLAHTFTLGLEASLKHGADVVVNTDADGQYDPADIARLVAPIVEGKADMVLGDRGVATLAHFSLSKRWLQRLGSLAVRVLSGIPVRDATTGFRAFSRRAAARINCFTSFTYTLETLIQAGQANFAVQSVDIQPRPTSRPSRLFRSNSFYVLISLATLARLVFIYRPLRSLLILSGLSGTVALGLVTRFLYSYFAHLSPAGHVQSLIAAAVLGLTAVQLAVLGVLADLTAVNRRLLDELRARAREAK
jgi:glycosyltransferase involved in cell wall biosynthesis